jgi:AcrR family transcriptional regulator
MSDFVVVTTGRAKPMSLEQRQDQIIGVTIELLQELGRDVTSKEIAEAAGIAEGTIFRAFGDKDTLIKAAVDRYLDPLPLRTAIRSIDPGLPVEEKVRVLVDLMLDRFRGVIRLMVAVGHQGPPRDTAEHKEEDRAFDDAIDSVLGPHRDQLRIEPRRVAHYLRVVALSSAIPAFGDAEGFTADELTGLVLHGIGKD